MSKNMKTFCVGRFLIDIPADATVSYRSAFISGWDITSDPEESESQFAARLEEKEAKLRTTNNKSGEQNLEATHLITSDPTRGKVFVFARTRTHGFENGKRVDDEFVSIDALVRSRAVSFDFSASYLDSQDSSRLIQLISQLREQQSGEIPSESGFCFERGIVLDPLTAKQAEGVTMFVSLKGHPDISIAFSTAAGRTPAKTLLERTREAESQFSPSELGRFVKLREGGRAINGVNGEETLEKVHEFNGAIGHNFIWETLRNGKDNVMSPYLILEMSSGHAPGGGSVSASLGDSEAIVLWDAISSSLRIRPTHKSSHNEPSVALGLGLRSIAGDECAQSGWWQCTDGIDKVDVQGGRVQYFRAGTQMPQALLLLPPTLWQKARGEQPTFQSKIPSSWKLVDRRKTSRPGPSADLAPAGLDPQVGADRSHHGVGATPSAATLGDKLESGTRCTASGWWMCMEPGALDGTRWFAEGTTHPLATKSVELSVLEKMKGTASVIRVPTSWQLVRFAQVAEQPESPSGAVLPGSSTADRGTDETPEEGA
jgi:hypothetical protein